MDLIKIGIYIAEKRKALGLTQKQLAEQLGMSDKSVSKWERGSCLPDVSVYLVLCGIVGSSMIVFLAGEALSEENIVKLNNQTYDVKGYLSLHDLNDYLDLDLDSEDFDSVGGLVIDALGRLPQTNDETTLPNGIRIKVLKVEKNRIESLRFKKPQTITQYEV